jgi:hypothetical protein
LIVYGFVAVSVFFGELRTENPFYPAPFRFYYGTIAVPALLPVWFGFLIADLIHSFRWQWLLGSIAAAGSILIGYSLIDAFTLVPG